MAAKSLLVAAVYSEGIANSSCNISLCQTLNSELITGIRSLKCLKHVSDALRFLVRRRTTAIDAIPSNEHHYMLLPHDMITRVAESSPVLKKCGLVRLT